VYPAAWAEDLAGKMSAGVGIVVRSVDMGSHRAVVLNFRTDAELDALVDGMNREWSRRGDERASIGLGSAGAGMGHLPQSYREATYAADYRLVWGSGIVVLFDAVRDADQCYYYPIATENVMINLLGAGERGRATELLSEVMARNLSQPGSPPGAIRNLALNIVLTAAKAAEEIGVGAELRLDTRRIQECGTIDELRGALDQIVTEVCALARRGRHEAPVLDQARVAAFVEDNLTNPELSLKMLADWCGISPSYASRCFLELFGVHFLDHVTALRIGKAKAMLEEGMLSIGEVALKVGYSSDVTFRRLFKSHEGFSPSGFQTLRKARTAGAGRI
jgi:AraC-like DNA-binding protein